MREILPLNDGWIFMRKSNQSEGTTRERVDLPHTNAVLPYNYLDERDYQFISRYERTLFAPEEWKDRRVFLQFEAVMAYAEVFLNGCLIGDHKGGYTPFSVELSEFLRFNDENCICVCVDSTERCDFAPCGNVVDYLTYGGIYREVSLVITERDFIRSVHVRGCRANCSERIEAKVLLGAPLSQNSEWKVFFEGHEAHWLKSAQISEKELQFQATFLNAETLRHWSPEDPALYDVVVELWQSGKRIDRISTRFGLRFCAFRPDGFYLNEKKIKLLGLNRHQSFPYVGGAMPARVQRRDADILKSLGMNLVRTSHYPQSRHFLDRCDEIGLMVFEEIPGWQHIGDQDWQDVSVCNVEEMIERDYNHPSIILWGVRINESQDNHAFYVRTNAAAHRLDTTRQTGGVRCITHSELLEDVYTFNEFIHDGGELVFRPRDAITGLEHPVPLLVTESNGHMFPTKRFDTESRLLEHAMRHLRVMNEALGRDDIAGEISWCAFDYNTHSGFGSGDKICYHGVSDMFRIPKYAGLALMSQRPAAQGIVLAPLSVISRGEKNGGGMFPFHIATNCDFVRVYKNGALLGDFYPNRALFPNLPHPPVEVMLNNQADEWGQAENNLRIEGYIGNEMVDVREVGETKSFARLAVEADDKELQVGGDTYDATRIIVRAIDTMGNLCPFYACGIGIQTNGFVQVIGPKNVALIGGCIAFWVRTCGQTGIARIRVESGNLSEEIQIQCLR